MADLWTVHRWWVPADVEGCFVQAWSALAEMLVAEGPMESVSLFADADEPRVRWTPLRWSSRTAWRAWRADARHRAVEDAMSALCDGARVHRMTTVLTSPHPGRDHRGTPRRHLLTHTTAPSSAPGPP
jgi:heme-degrading monooxygenase HmoA